MAPKRSIKKPTLGARAILASNASALRFHARLRYGALAFRALWTLVVLQRSPVAIGELVALVVPACGHWSCARAMRWMSDRGADLDASGSPGAALQYLAALIAVAQVITVVADSNWCWLIVLAWPCVYGGKLIGFLGKMWLEGGEANQADETEGKTTKVKVKNARR